MGRDLLFFSLIVVSAVLAYYVLWASFFLWWKPRSMERQLRLQGIKGSSYRLIYGNMKEEAQVIKEAWSRPMDLTHRIAPRVVPFAHQMVQNYGKICLMWAGTRPRLIIWDLEMMKVVLNDKLGQIQKNPRMKLLAIGISSLEGETWSKRRRIISPAFHLEKLKGMMPAFLASCVDLVERWDKLIDEKGGCCELDVWPEFQNLTADVISRTAFGSSFQEGKRIFQLQKELTSLVIEASRAPYFPLFRYLPTAKNRRRAYVDGEIKSTLREICKKRKAMRMKEFVCDDLLGLLLQSNDLNEQEVIDECKLFYFAGQETTSSWLTWTLVLLAMHHNWQQKAREEVLQRCGKSTPNFESIASLKIVNMILNEVLRLYPPIVSQFRHTKKSTRLGGIFIPAGIDLLLPTILIHHDPHIWGEDAEEFNPERFSEGISKASNGQNAFFPFGWGPRICLGQSFAMIEAKLALAIILQHYSFELSPSYAHAPYTIITLQPQLGAHLVVHQL